MPNPTATGSEVAARTRRIDSSRSHRESASGTRDTETRNEVDEPLGIVNRPLESVGASRRSDQTHEIDTTSLYRRLERGISACRQIREDETCYLELFRVMQESIDPILENRIEIAEDHDRGGRLRAGDELQRTGKGHPRTEGLEGGSLDGGAVGEGIAEGNSDFDDIRHLGRRP